MSFVHPSVVSCAIGAAMTMLDLYLSQQSVLEQALRELDTLRLRSGENLLDALARRGAVHVCRDEAGQVTRVYWSSAVPQVLLEMGRLECGRPAV